MKKIFAIALALVMVLSMASAFATYCNWGAWDCDATTIRCGKATVEVVPYVRASTACGFEFAANGCAAAIKGENVYYAIKLVVDADVNEDWWNAATLTIKGTDVDTAGTYADKFDISGEIDYSVVKGGGTWWLQHPVTTGAEDFAPIANADAWVKEDSDFTFGAKNVFGEKATSSKAQICATLKSVWAIGTAKDHNIAWGDHERLAIGDYTFEFGQVGDAKTVKVWKGAAETDKEIWIVLDKDNKVDFAWVSLNSTSTTAEVQYKLNGRNPAGEFTGVKTGTNEAVALGTACNEGAFLKEVFDFLKIDFGTCMTDQGISNNFGWNDSVKSCTAYKTQGSAVVDAECVVAIPKTGDASVLAWLF